MMEKHISELYSKELGINSSNLYMIIWTPGSFCDYWAEGGRGGRVSPLKHYNSLTTIRNSQFPCILPCLAFHSLSYFSFRFPSAWSQLERQTCAIRMPMFRRSASSHSTSDAAAPPTLTNVTEGSPVASGTLTRQKRSRSHGGGGSPASTFSSRFGIPRYLPHQHQQSHEQEQGEAPRPDKPATKEIPVSSEPEVYGSEAGEESNFGQEPADEQLVPETGSWSPQSRHSSRKLSVQTVEPSSDDEVRSPEERRVSPLIKRLGEEPPFMLPHPSRADSTYQEYPGVVIGSFAGGGPDTLFGNGMQLEGTMDDILDPNAARQEDRGNQAPAGANIAPWLMDDSPPSPSENPSPASPATQERPVKGPAAALREKDLRKASTVLNHFSSVPSLPKIRRHGRAETTTPDQTPRGSTHSQSNLASSSSSLNNESRESRAGSDDSIQTTLTQKGRRQSPGEWGQASAVPPPSKGTRPGRFGSTASIISGTGSVGEKKKGLFGGLLKRKTNPNLSLSGSITTLVKVFG